MSSYGSGWPSIGAERAQDLPVLARLARRIDRRQAALHPPLGVHVGAVLLGIGRARQDHVGARRAAIAVVALIDHEGLGPDRARCRTRRRRAATARRRRRFSMLGEVLAALARQEAEIQRADPRRRGVQHVEAVPVGVEHARVARRASSTPPGPPRRPAAPARPARRSASASSPPSASRRSDAVPSQQRGQRRPARRRSSRVDRSGRPAGRSRRSGSRPASQRLRMRALITGASRRGLLPTISSASASSMPAIEVLNM